MGRSTRALARIYISRALADPATWLAAGWAAFYTLFTTLEAVEFFRQQALPFNLVEVMLYVLNDYLFVTYGLLLPFILLISPTLRVPELERLVAYRMRSRHEFLVCRVLTFTALSGMFYAVVALTAVAVALPSHPVSKSWSPTYIEAARISYDGSEETPLHLKTFLSRELVETTAPLSFLVRHGALSVFVLMTLGLLASVLVHVTKKRVTALLLVVTYIFADRILSMSGLSEFLIATPQTHLLWTTRLSETPGYLSYGASFVGWASVFVALAAADLWFSRRMNLG